MNRAAHVAASDTSFTGEILALDLLRAAPVTQEPFPFFIVPRFVRAEALDAIRMHAENSRESGRIRFAAAAPTGFPQAALLSVTLRVAKAGTRPVVTLDMRELNTTDGASLLQQLVAVPSP